MAQTCENPGDSAAAEQIREQRITFNTAIGRADIAGLESILHENIVLITGTNSDIYLGRDAQVNLWKEDFAQAERAVYVRTSDCIRVSPLVSIAMETGSWRGVFNTDADSFAAGSYAAKWRKQDGAWLLESEIFATEACGGDFCP
jgi:ketosteroid isomerase-like protein